MKTMSSMMAPNGGCKKDEIICIDDSDSEEELENIRAAIKQKTATSTSAAAAAAVTQRQQEEEEDGKVRAKRKNPAEMQTEDEGCIDLCESSSDEDNNNNDDDSSDGELEIVGEPVFNNRRSVGYAQASTMATMKTTSTTLGLSQDSMTSIASSTASISSCGPKIRNPYSKSPPPAATASIQQQQKNMRMSTQQHHQPPPLSLSQDSYISIASSTNFSSSSTPVVNPYAKKRKLAPTSSSSTASSSNPTGSGSQMKNPYLKKTPSSSTTTSAVAATTTATPRSLTYQSSVVAPANVITNPYSNSKTKQMKRQQQQKPPRSHVANYDVDSDDSDSIDLDDLLSCPLTTVSNNKSSSKIAKNKRPRTSSVGKDVPISPLRSNMTNSYATAAASTTPASTNTAHVASARQYLSSATTTTTTPNAAATSTAFSSSSSAFCVSAKEFVYPTLLNNSVQHEDLRAKFALALWKYARSLTTKSHERAKLDQTMKKIVKLALLETPIRSLEELLTINKTSITVGNMKQPLAELRQQLEYGKFGQVPHTTPSSRHGNGYYTIVEACLTALYDHVNERFCIDRSTDGSIEMTMADKLSWVTVQQLISMVDGRLRREAVSKLRRPNDEDGWGVAYYLNPSTRSAEWLQIVKLECSDGNDGPKIKRHKRQGVVCFELLPLGYEVAQRIKARSFPSPKGFYRTSRQICTTAYPNICLGVDRQEGGGQLMLHEMCNKLDMQKVPYFVGSLAIGDYVFFTKKSGGSNSNNLYVLCPILIERKSIEDIAMSIYDGRWKSQKQKMYRGQFLFGYAKCRMVYIIEGNIKRQQMTGGYIGHRHYNVDDERIEQELSNLKEEGFDIIRTPSRENTMFELCRWCTKIAKDISNGTMKPSQYTYEEFKTKLKTIPSDTDFSRLAKYYRFTQQQQQAEMEGTSKGEDADTNKDSDDSEPEIIQSTESTTKKSAKKQKRRQKEVESVDSDEFAGYSVAKLKQMCKSVGLAASGSRSELFARYRGPHPPKVWLLRKQRNQYVPASYNVAGTALLVALYLHEKQTGGLDKGLTKDELYVKAEGLAITKNPFSGGTTQTGPYHYDGWSTMSSLLKGDPALVIMSKKRYKLTRSCNLAGFTLAEALHKWCHEHNNCPCGAEI